VTTSTEYHALERTSPKGPGQKFIGRCIRCGMTGLQMSAAMEGCKNTAEMTGSEALLAAVRGLREPRP